MDIGKRVEVWMSVAVVCVSCGDQVVCPGSLLIAKRKTFRVRRSMLLLMSIPMRDDERKGGRRDTFAPSRVSLANSPAVCFSSIVSMGK